MSIRTSYLLAHISSSFNAEIAPEPRFLGGVAREYHAARPDAKMKYSLKTV